jgi:hypothetical protein
MALPRTTALNTKMRDKEWFILGADIGGHSFPMVFTTAGKAIWRPLHATELRQNDVGGVLGGPIKNCRPGRCTGTAPHLAAPGVSSTLSVSPTPGNAEQPNGFRPIESLTLCWNGPAIGLDLLAARLQMYGSGEGNGASLRETRKNEREASSLNRSQHKENSKMKNIKVIALVCIGVLGAALPHAKADEWNQKTIFTFSGPVEIPGQVLDPGTYVFKLVDSQSDRNIVQVFNRKENHLYGTFLTIPDYRLKPTGKTMITFEERAAGAPEAVRAWFYPGDNYGHEFVYPKVKAVELAKANNQPVASMPTELAANTTMPATTMKEPHVVAMKQAPLKAQQPTEEEVEIAEVFVVSQPPASLPQTASSLPLLGLIGLLAFGLAWLLRRAEASWI